MSRQFLYGWLTWLGAEAFGDHRDSKSYLDAAHGLPGVSLFQMPCDAGTRQTLCRFGVQQQVIRYLRGVRWPNA